MALIPPFYFDCVVAIGKPAGHEIAWVASGFLYGEFLRVEGDRKWYNVFLVTNRHVFQGLKQVFLRFNPKGDGEPAKQYPLSLLDASSKQLWTAHPHPEIDVAVRRVNVNLLGQEGIQFSYFQSDQHMATLDRMAELGITEGDFIYTLGFPMGIVGGARNYVIARSGSIARIQDALNRKSKEALIDTFIFPGNSGSPVVTKPESVAIKNTKAVQDAYLIGVVKSFIPYRDVAISAQTQQPRVVFEENSGLAAFVPIDFVQEAIKEHQRRFPSAPSASLESAASQRPFQPTPPRPAYLGQGEAERA